MYVLEYYLNPSGGKYVVYDKMEDNQKSIYSIKSNYDKTCSNSIEFFHIDMKQNCLFNLYNIKNLVFYTYIPCRTTSLVVYIGESILQLPLKSRLHNYTWLNALVNEINRCINVYAA